MPGIYVKTEDGLIAAATAPGPMGPEGPPNTLTVGTVTTGAPGSAADADITGDSPNQTLALTIPRGDVGETGATGPPNSLTIGTVTTGTPGTDADADIDGTAPNQTLSLVIPRGDVGDQGEPGDPGEDGAPGETRYLVEDTGVYPPRPEPLDAPVTFVGVTDPSAFMIIGDSWLDISPISVVTIDGGSAAEPMFVFKPRRDTAAGWAAENPVLADGEEGIDITTGTRRIGNGVDTWDDLPASSVTDHGALTGRGDDDHTQYALADGSRGDFAATIHAHDYEDLDNLPTLGSAAASASGDFATAAQGAKADTAVQPAALTAYATDTELTDGLATKASTSHAHATSDVTGLDAALSAAATDADLTAHASDTTAVHGIADTSALVLTGDARLTDARTPTAHTHPSSEIPDFTEAAQDAIAALLAGASGVSLSYNDVANTLTITGGGDAGLDAEAVRDAIGVALIGSGLITVTVNDALDTITISTTATANASDAALRDRATHTGEQAISTITALSDALSGKAPVADVTALDSRIDALEAAPAGSGLFRGQWSSLTLTDTLTLPGTGSPIVAPFTAVSGLTTTIANPGGAGAPAGSSVLRVYGQGGSVDVVDFTVPAGTDVITFLTYVFMDEGGTSRLRVLKNASEVLDLNGAHGWTLRTVSVASGDVVRFESIYDGTYRVRANVGDFKLYASTEPYMSGEYVLHLNRLWQSDVDNNAGTPGTSGWTEARLTVDAADIADSTSTGRSLLTAADAAAARTVLSLGSAALSASGDFAPTSDVTALDSRVDALEAAPGSPGLFRGEWSSLTVVQTLSITAVLPPEITNSVGWSTTDTTATLEYWPNNPVGGTPPTGSKVITSDAMNGGSPPGTWERVTFTVPSGVDFVQFVAAIVTAADPTNTAYGLEVNGVLVVEDHTLATWESHLVPVNPGDVVGLAGWDRWNSGTRVRFGQIELLAATEPYMAGEYVLHLDRLWKSDVDNNAGTPGASGWTEATLTTDSTDITDSTSTGRAILTAANASAARTVLSLGSASLAASGDFAPASHDHTSADTTDFTEAAQDVVGAMVAAAGGTYDDGTNTITLPGGGDPNLVIGTVAPTPDVGVSVLWVDTTGGNVTINLVTGE